MAPLESKQEEGGVDPREWDPSDPQRSTVKKKQRRYSFEQQSNSSKKRDHSRK